MIDLTDKVTVITGGSRGIGAACARLFADAHARVALTYRKSRASANRLIASLGPRKKIKAYAVDIECEEDIKSTVKKIIADFGKIDILVNNAGIWKYGKVDELSLQQWEETIRINLTGAFLFVREVVPYMKVNRFGRIINVSSTAGQRGEAFYSHYAASKGGMISFTKSLAAELAGNNITVNCVAPGWVETDMTSEVLSDRDYKTKLEKEVPVGRFAPPEDIAGPVLFLASELARHINGEILNVNGGSVLCG
jgi:3-oxoacyl-[acyl-carrier protein] reductase